MNKAKIKQIYLLTIIVGGIIALSVYSTYAIFTLESETSDIVSIHTPNTLNVSLDMYEYKQVTVSKNSYITTDIDIYNNFDYEICYSIWYKIIENSSIDKSKVKVYQSTDNSLTTSSTIKSINSQRITLLIVNDNDSDAKLNIGLSHTENNETCELNISKDKSLVLQTINNPKNLSETLTKNLETKNNEAGYLTYKDNNQEINLDNLETIYISDKFTYKDEIFTLSNPEEISLEKIKEYHSNESKSYYTCIDNFECNYLYRIIETKEESKENTNEYILTKYDTLVGYLGGNSGLRKVNDDYYYYGDNPNNFIYYNCSNEIDIKTCELWRIIGYTYDKENNNYLTKIIRNDYIDTINYNELNNNIWNNSSIQKYLEEYKIKNANTLKERTFKIENIIDLNNNLSSIIYLKDDNKSNVVLMDLTDYLNTSLCENKKISEYNNECLNNNWLNKNSSLNEWTKTVKYEEEYIDEETNEKITPENNMVYSVGNNISLDKVSTKLNIRPLIYLSPRTFLISGDGTLNNPYIVK